MASLPQTWKHSEPKALWPTLSGLAVLVHLGILGFSLPYLIELMQPAPGSRSSVVPIELIVDSASIASQPNQQPSPNSEESAASPAQAIKPQATESASQPVANQPTSQPAGSIETGAAATLDTTLQTDTASSSQSQVEIAQEPARTEPESRDANPPTDRPGSESVDPSSPTSDFQTPDAQTPDTQTPNSETPDTVEPDTASSSPLTSDLPSDSSPDDSPPNDSLPDDSLPDDSLPDESLPEEAAAADPLPVLPSDQAIPTPGSEAASSDLPQSAYIRVVGYEEVPRSLQRDLVTQPPAPLNEELAEIELRPQDANCAQLDFSQPQVTYRITVNTDGSMRAASPWTGSIEQRPPLSKEESAIACLLLASDFRFTPATLEGEPVVNDNLLLTIDIVESQPTP